MKRPWFVPLFFVFVLVFVVVQFKTTPSLRNEVVTQKTREQTWRFGRPWIDHLMGRDPRVLVIMIGQHRGGELAWRSFIENVLETNQNTDLALCTTGHAPKTLLERAQFYWNVPEQDWGALIDRRCGNSEWRARQCFNGQQFLGGVRGCPHPGSAGILLAYREIVAEKIREFNLTAHYDAFLLTRTDYAYRCEHPPFWRLARDAVWARDGEEQGGFSDRHIFAFGELFLKAIGVAAHVCDPEFKADQMNLERLQMFYFKAQNLNVRKMSVPAFAIRVGNDPSSWSPGEPEPEIDDVGKVKYHSEFNLAKHICGV